MNKTLTETGDKVIDLIDTGLADEKARKVGFFVRRWTAIVVAPPDDRTWQGGLEQHDEGTVLYLAKVQATRDGVSFGASQPHLRYTTAEQRERDIAKLLASGKARYLKKYSK